MQQQQQPDVMLLGDAAAAIAAITSKRRLDRLASWPEVSGGGVSRMADVAAKCYQILHLPLESTGPKSLEYVPHPLHASSVYLPCFPGIFTPLSQVPTSAAAAPHSGLCRPDAAAADFQSP
jgi:hypothetical protein